MAQTPLGTAFTYQGRLKPSAGGAMNTMAEAFSLSGTAGQADADNSTGYGVYSERPLRATGAVHMELLGAADRQELRASVCGG